MLCGFCSSFQIRVLTVTAKSNRSVNKARINHNNKGSIEHKEDKDKCIYENVSAE